MNESQNIGMHENMLRMILIIAACLAIGSIGFFFAVLLQHAANNASGVSAKVLQVTVQEKSTVVNSLAPSDAFATSSGTSTVAAAHTKASQVQAVSPTQADTSDPNAAAKLDVLDKLNQ